MSKKGKSRTNPNAELHFVAAIQLEEVAILIGNLANRQHEVSLSKVTEDEIRFRISYRPKQAKEAEIWGTLQRWQGTETKIDANGHVLRLSDLKSDDGGPQGCFSLLLGGFDKSSIAKLGENDKSTISFRARDYLLQLLIDTIQSVSEVQGL